jgi:hypothetical protein
MPDFTTHIHGSLVVFYPHTEDATRWWATCVQADPWQYTQDGGCAVDLRYAAHLISCMDEDGLIVQPA